MRPIGFSTGALAKGDFRSALSDSLRIGATAVELSALRWHELDDLDSTFESLGVRQFKFVSVHLPSKFPSEQEEQLVRTAKRFVARGAVVVAHPDTITRRELWRELGAALLIENMDKRKPIGRSAAELEEVFRDLDEAGLCFDVGHARQIDPSLTEARQIVTQWSSRIRMLHVSDVASNSVHEPLSTAGSEDLAWLSSLLPAEVPAIIESPVSPEQADDELNIVVSSLQRGLRLAIERRKPSAAA